MASASSESRNWSTLPAQVRLTRQPADPGLQSFVYDVKTKRFNLAEFKLNNNQIKVWNIRNPH